MANYIISDCIDENLTYITSYDGTDIIIGNTYYLTFSDDLLPSGCYKIEDEDVQIGFVSILTVTPYDSCYDCLSNNNYFVSFQNCTGLGVDGVVLISDFGSSPIVGQVYYFSFTEYSTVYTDCFIITNIITSPKEVGFLLTTPVLQTGCETCLSSNSLPYRVTRCTDSIVDYVMLINDSLNGHLISYSDGINQYCGVVNNQETGSPEMTFITDYGPSIDVECPTCLSTVNQKVLLQSCTDVEYQEVVWASSLYGVGEISNLSTSSGCFEIVGPTENPITINNFLNFDPQPGCNACIECNGIYYSFVDCNDQPFGSILSYEYLSAGTVVFDTNFNKCLKINGITNSANDISYSYINFNDCTDCLENNVNVDIWSASACTISGQYTQFFVTTIGPVSTGDTVKLMWGSNEWVCVTLLENLPYGNGQSRGIIYSAKRNELNQTITYESCESCNINSTIGITLTTCDAPYTESFVQISLENYLSIYNFGSLQNTSVSDVDGKCYRIINLCPIPLTATTEFTPVKFYYSCTLCKNDNNYIPPRSAGTEVFVCEVCCECGATGGTINQVTAPHPVWTDGYGTPVTQLNMIVLGGINGLNS